jgi:hypothetical protein
MLLHPRELRGRKRSRLQQDGVSNRDLAEVVKDAAVIEELAVLCPETACRAHCLRVATDPLGVMDGVPVARLDRAREREEDALGRVEPLVQRAVSQKHLRADEQLLGVEGLAQVVVRPGRDATELRVSIVRRGEDDDRDKASQWVRLELLAHRDAIEPRHVDVEQDQVRLVRRDRVERLDPVACLAHLVAEIGEIPLEELPVRRDVVDNQDLRP